MSSKKNFNNNNFKCLMKPDVDNDEKVLRKTKSCFLCFSRLGKKPLDILIIHSAFE